MTRQFIELENSSFKVTLDYFENREETGNQLIITSFDLRNQKTNSLSFNCGAGFYFIKKTATEPTQTVKLVGNKLIVTFYQNLSCFNIEDEIFLDWELDFNDCPIYDFLDIEADILLRGELQIFRINRAGKIIWSTYGSDIWVNLEGEKEMVIEGDNIILTDFNGRKYTIKIEDTKTI